MFKKIIDKLFCSHKWNSHGKEIYESSHEEMVYETRYWGNPEFQTIQSREIREILICEKCGRVKKIQY